MRNISDMDRIACSVAVVLLAASALVGCSVTGGGVQQQESTTAAADPTESSPVATYPGTAIGFDAAIEGTLRLVDNCVVMGTESASFVPVFPDESDVSWHDGVLTWNGSKYQAGDTVSFGGGGTASVDSYIPHGCAELQTILVGA